MGYLQSVARLSQEDNLGGLLQLKVARKADISALPDPIGGTIYGDIIFVGSAGWVSWDVTLTPRLQSNEQLAPEGDNVSKNIEFIIAKDRPGLRHMLTLMKRDEFVVLVKDGSGRQKVVGMPYAPLQFTFRHDTGQIGDRNQYACKFYYDGPDNEYFYAGAVTPPSGVATATVSFNGSVIASLEPGQTLNIESEFGFTDFFITT